MSPARIIPAFLLSLVTMLAHAAPVAVHAVVTIAPLKGLVEPLLPPGSTIRVLMPPGRSEHGYEFTPADMAELARADLVVFVGLGLEPQVQDFVVSHASPKRIDLSLSEALGLHTTHEEHAETDAANPGKHNHENCDHGPIDPHVWLDPELVVKATPRIADAAREAVQASGKGQPAEQQAATDAIARNLLDQSARIAKLQADLAATLAPFKGAKIVTHHAAFGRFAERYGLTIAEVIKGTEGAEPTPGRVAAIVDAVKAEQVRAIFIEPQFNSVAAERIAKAAGVKLGRLDPLGDGDWFALMRSNADAIATSLK
ncbi:MAG: metal ABC transporter substrate-binding protein [Phycisphaerales bacterium]|nr:metal ABC transporter substrate-binding protein [Phycisphaerales bacterium]